MVMGAFSSVVLTLTFAIHLARRHLRIACLVGALSGLSFLLHAAAETINLRARSYYQW